MKKKETKNFKGIIIILGVFISISLFLGLIQLVSFVYLLREIPGLLDLILLR